MDKILKADVQLLMRDVCDDEVDCFAAILRLFEYAHGIGVEVFARRRQSYWLIQQLVQILMGGELYLNIAIAVVVVVLQVKTELTLLLHGHLRLFRSSF